MYKVDFISYKKKFLKNSSDKISVSLPENTRMDYPAVHANLAHSIQSCKNLFNWNFSCKLLYNLNVFFIVNTFSFQLLLLYNYH